MSSKLIQPIELLVGIKSLNGRAVGLANTENDGIASVVWNASLKRWDKAVDIPVGAVAGAFSAGQMAYVCASVSIDELLMATKKINALKLQHKY